MTSVIFLVSFILDLFEIDAAISIAAAAAAKTVLNQRN